VTPNYIPRVKTLRELVTRRSAGAERHIHQFQIACLELDRTRRMKELTAATQRIQALQAMLSDIDGEIEKRRQLLALGAGQSSSPGPAAHPTTPHPTTPHLGPPRSAARRTLRY